MNSPCEDCKNKPEAWEISVFMLDAGHCRAGHYISQTDAAPPTHYFDDNHKLIANCKDFRLQPTI